MSRDDMSQEEREYLMERGGEGPFRRGAAAGSSSSSPPPPPSAYTGPAAPGILRGGRRGGRGAGWLFTCGHCCKVTLIVTAVLFALVRLTSIDFKMSALLGQEDSLGALAGSLVEHETEFGLSVYTSIATSRLLLLKLSVSEDVLLGLKDPPLLVFSATFSKGALLQDETVALKNYSAESTDRTVFYVKPSEDLSSVDLYRKQLVLRTTDEGMEASLAGSAPDEWLASFPVAKVGKSPDGERFDFLFLGNGLLERGFFITQLAAPGTMLDMRLELSTVRSFPRNFDLTVEYELVADELGDAIPLSLRYSVAALPEEPMVPRVADERVGYFSTVYHDIGFHLDHVAEGNDDAAAEGTSDIRKSTLLNTTVRLINKRRMSRESPLLYYIDPSVPGRWRQALKEGVEAWQGAFESAGWGPRAIRAVLPDDADWPEDYDASDIRYNSITWDVDMDEVFAIGPSTLDPRTGEILRSNIVFTSGWVEYWVRDMENTGESGTTRDAALHSVNAVSEHSHHGHISGLCMHNRLRAMLEGGGGISSMALMERLMAAGEDSNDSGAAEKIETFIAAGLKDVTQHEVGHTLGLRHNFQGSAQGTLAQLQDRAYTSKHGLTSSVMDYLPPNIVSKKAGGGKPNVEYFPSSPGEYDVWAIEYGYKELEGGAGKVAEPLLYQHKDLVEVASRGLAFATDEDEPRESGVNPRVNAFDLSADPLSFYEDRLELVQELRQDLLERSVREGESYTRFANAERAMLSEISRAGIYSLKYIGGFELSKQRRSKGAGSVGPLASVLASDQKRALDFIVKLLTDDASVAPAPETLKYMVKPAGECNGLEQSCLGREPMDVTDLITRARQLIIENLLSIERLKRLKLQSWGGEADDGAQTVSSVLGAVTQALWGEGFRGKRVGDQRNWATMLFWVDSLLALASAPETPADISAIAAGEVYRLRRSAPDQLSEVPTYESWFSLVYSLDARIVVWLEEGGNFVG